MNEQSTNNITRILELSVEILETVRSLKERRSAYEGEPLLDFSEVCQLLHQSERQVRRYREQGHLVGFTIGHRRMYLLSEVRDFIGKMRRRGKFEELKKLSLIRKNHMEKLRVPEAGLPARD